jgi:hypothetical protein
VKKQIEPGDLIEVTHESPEWNGKIGIVKRTPRKLEDGYGLYEMIMFEVPPDWCYVGKQAFFRGDDLKRLS